MGDILFSIVIPVWNREESILRCLESIQKQTFKSYEVIIVDDGSVDNTIKNIKKFSRLDIRLIELNENKGVCAARRAGTEIAEGEWIVSLDSDWSLLPQALETFSKMINCADDDIGVIGGRAKIDTGVIIPENKFPSKPFGFEEYIKWLDKTRVSDYQPCRRKKVFDNTKWPNDFRLESKFHLTVAKNWNMWVSEEIVATCHTDCANRWTANTTKQGIEGRIKRAPFIAKDSEEILYKFGKDLKKLAPNYYFIILYKASYFNFWAGKKLAGVKYGLRALHEKPTAIHVVGLVIAGLLGVENMIKLKNIGLLSNLYKKAYKLNI